MKFPTALFRCWQLYNNEADFDIFPVLLNESIRAAERLREMQSIHVLNAVLRRQPRTPLYDSVPQWNPLQQANQKRASHRTAQRALVLPAQVNFVYGLEPADGKQQPLFNQDHWGRHWAY